MPLKNERRAIFISLLVTVNFIGPSCTNLYDIYMQSYAQLTNLHSADILQRLDCYLRRILVGLNLRCYLPKLKSFLDYQHEQNEWKY